MDRTKRTGILVALLTLMALASACQKGGPLSPFEFDNPLVELTQTMETENFIFHYSWGDFIETDRAEAYHRWAVAFMGVLCPKKIDYFKFKDREQMYRVTGSASTGFADIMDFEIWTYLPWLSHECMHLYSMLFGHPPTLFLEGIGVAYQIDPYAGDFEAREFNGERIHDIVRRYKAQGKLYPLASLITAQGWAQADFTTTYPQAGSFVRFLADGYGIEKVKQIFIRMGKNDAAQAIQDKFLAIYGFSLAQAEDDWLRFLN